MDKFKIDDYERDHGAGTFPKFRTLTKDEAHAALDLVKQRMGLPRASNAEDVLCEIDQRSIEVAGVDASLDGFDLEPVIEQLGFSSSRVLLNWYRFDRIDEFRLVDLCKFFGDIFYSSSDDLEVLDPSVSWLLSIRHYGAVKALRFS